LVTVYCADTLWLAPDRARRWFHFSVSAKAIWRTSFGSNGFARMRRLSVFPNRVEISSQE
jgi:hypothetical protein